MAKRNRLEKFGVKLAVVNIPFDVSDEYAHPWVVLTDGAERWPEVILRIDMQRNRLRADGYHQSPWERFHAVEDAKAIPGWLDVGRAAYSYCYGAHVDSLRLQNLKKVAALAAACGLSEVYDHGGDILTPILAAIESAGCPVVRKYVGRGTEYDSLLEMPSEFQGHAARFSQSAAALEAIAAYHAEQAARARQIESEREAMPA